MKHLYLASLAILLTCTLYSQDGKNKISLEKIKGKVDSAKKVQTQKAIYDFEKQEYVSDELRPVHKQPVILKIININKIANKVEMISSDVKIKDDFLDAEEKQVVNIIEADKPAESINVEAINVDLKIPAKVLEDNDKKTKPKTSEIKILNNQIENFERDIAEKRNKIEKNSILIDVLENDISKYKKESNDELKSMEITASPEQKSVVNKKFEDLSNPFISKKETFINENIELKSAIVDLVENKSKALNSLKDNNDDLRNFKLKATILLEKYSNFNKMIKDINRINSAYNNYIDYIINPSLTHFQYKNDAIHICSIIKDNRLTDYHTIINTTDEKFTEFIEYYNMLKNDDLYYEIVTIDESYANLVKLQIENLKKDVDSVYKLINVNELRKKLNNVEIINNVLSKEKAFTVVSNPVQPLEDYVEFKVKIKQNKELGTSIIKENDKDFTYFEYVRKGIRWDVSVGTVFDFGIKNQEYEVQKIDSNNFKIIENNSSSYTPTLAGIIHTSFRTNNMFAFGLSLGISIDVTELNFNSFFPGVSLLIGKREKMIFTIGPAFKKVQQIKSIYKNKEDRDLTAEIQVADITNEQFKIGYFFGITYNLTNSQKSKIKNLQ